jgi:hypothetical protein
MQIQKWILLLGLAFAGVLASAKDICTIETDDSPAVTDVLRVRLDDGVEFQLETLAPNGEDKLAQLSEDKRELFLRRRHEILTSVARSLAYPRALGFAAWAKSKVKKCFTSSAANSQAEALAGVAFSGEANPGAVKSLGYAAIAGALRTIDAVLWEDYYVVTNAKSVSLSTYLSASAGLGVGRWGFLGWRGLELDFAYDFEKKARYVRLSWLNQSMKSSFYCFELMMSLGVLLRQYELDPSLETQTATSIHTPAVLMVRHGPSLVGWGGVIGVTAFEVLGLGMLSKGHYELGTALLTVPKILATGSTYAANLQKTTLVKKYFGCARNLIDPAKRI